MTEIPTWIQTFTGRKFNYTASVFELAEVINIIDIAQALSKIPRFAGQGHKEYSVGQHCLNMSEYTSPENKLAALLHDAAEAYIGDIPSPMKQSFPEIIALEEKIMTAVALKFRLTTSTQPYVLPAEIKQLDYHLLYLEARQQFPQRVEEWEERFRQKSLEHVALEFTQYCQAEVVDAFIARFNRWF